MAFNPYYGYTPNQYGKSPYYMQQPIATPQYQPQATEYMSQMQNAYQKPLGLQGKTVDNIEVVKATDIPLDGSISYFPLANGSAIITKQLMQDGTSKITIYEPKTQKDDIKFATIEDIDKRLEKLDFSEIDDLKEEINDLKKELKELKNKLKTKKED